MRWAPHAAALWSTAYLFLGILWLGGRGSYPWHRDSGDTSGINLLGGLDPRSVSWLVVGTSILGLGVTGTMLALSRRPGRGLGLLRLTALTAATMGIVLSVVVPDFRILATAGYIPIVAVMTIFDMDTGQMWSTAFSWPIVNLMILTLGGATFLAAAVSHWRLAADGCQRCGRDDGVSRWATPQSAGRWGRWATGIAIVVPVGYATTRVAWALGIPFGVSQRLLDEIGEARYAGASLGLLGVGGAVLTAGLTRPWGETWPRWIPWLRGRRVPVAAAVIPASIVSFIVMSAGLMFVRLRLSGGLASAFPGETSDIAAWLPEMFWPLWALSLAAATYAYWLRRRGRCVTCGRSSQALHRRQPVGDGCEVSAAMATTTSQSSPTSATQPGVESNSPRRSGPVSPAKVEI
jgi:hypothetical protein